MQDGIDANEITLKINMIVIVIIIAWAINGFSRSAMALGCLFRICTIQTSLWDYQVNKGAMS